MGLLTSSGVTSSSALFHSPLPFFDKPRNLFASISRKCAKKCLKNTRISLLLHPNTGWFTPCACLKDGEHARSELGRFAKKLTLFSQLATDPLPGSFFS